MSSAVNGKKVLLIGWDAADWKFINPLVDAGLMPNLAALINVGVIANLASLRPCLSPILWTSIATGKTADQHGIAGFVEPIPGGGGVRLSSSTSRKTKALWNILSQNDLSSIIVNWYASHPAEPVRGITVSNRFFEGLPQDPSEPWQVIPGSVHPASLEAVINPFRMHPAELGLNDLKTFIPGIETIDLSRDARPSQLAQILARTVSVHSVATAAMEVEPWDFFAVYYDGLDAAGHEFMPFHPPRLNSVNASDYEMYQHVMREVYLFHDQMLGRLLELAGENTTVILLSDHGFHCDHLRPSSGGHNETAQEQAARWHRHYGVLAMKGPGILADERLYGATLLDIAPTVLTIFGLPIGEDMCGATLQQAFEERAKVTPTFVPSWDAVPGADGMHAGHVQNKMMESPEVVAQLVALGYLPAETVESQKGAAIAMAESQFNLALVHASHARPQQALELFEQLAQADPHNPRFAVALAKAYADQGRHDQSLAIVERLVAAGHQSLECELLMAAGWFNVGRSAEALEQLKKIEAIYPHSPQLFRVIGDIYLQQSEWLLAKHAFSACLRLDNEEPHAHYGLGRAAMKLGEYELTVDHSLDAIGLLFFFPQAHFQLGLALKQLGDRARALRSFELAVHQAPRFLEVHRELAELYEQSNNLTLWLKHDRLANGMQLE